MRWLVNDIIIYAIITLTKTKYIPKHKTVIGIIVYVALLILGAAYLNVAANLRALNEG